VTSHRRKEKVQALIHRKSGLTNKTSIMLFDSKF
jgi:hypothetical protein